MTLNRLTRVRIGLAVCTLLFSLTVSGVASAQTGPRIIAATTLKSFTWQPRSAIDAGGNIYITGLTATSTGNFVTVTKIDPALQTVLYSKVLGQGWLSPIVIDAAGYAWVGAGTTLYKLDPAGTVVRQWNSSEIIMDLALGPQGHVYSASVTNPSCNQPDEPECSTEVVVLKIDPATGQSTNGYSLGGARNDQPHSIDVGADGHVVLVGYTFSIDLPVTANALMSTRNDWDNPDGFIAMLDSNLQPTYVSYLHGEYHGEAYAAAAGFDGAAYVAFDADQSPLLPAGGGNVVIKFDAAGNVVFMRRIKGQVQDIAEDVNGQLVVTGGGAGVHVGVETRHVVGASTTADAYIVKLAADGASYDVVVYVATGQAVGRTLSLGSDGTAVVAGDLYTYYGGTVAQETPLTNPPDYQSYNEMNFVSKVDLTIPAGNTPTGADVTIASSDPASSVTFSTVDGPGTTTMTPVDAAALNLSLPGGFAISNSSIAYDIQTTAAISGSITVCLNAASLTAAELASATILHGVGGQWVAEPTTNTGDGRLCATVSSLSPFAVGVRVDATPPTISITSPTARVYLVNESVTAQFTCADAGTVASCTANPSGAVLDTTSVGSRTFTVTATDAAGNQSTASVTYTVGYRVVTLFNQTVAFKSGSTARLVVQLTDAQGVNRSARGIALTNVTVDGQPISELFTFKSDLVAYALNLKMTGLAPGTHTLAFTAGDDPQRYTVSFMVR